MDEEVARTHGRLSSWAQASLRPFLSDFDVNGLLDSYPLFLLSSAQWRELIPSTQSGRALDVGAAAGHVTSRFAALFGDLCATETSWAMARRLRRRGIACERVDIASAPVPAPPYDVVLCLNVIDRCDRPRSLLRNAYAALRPGGHLVVAAPLPLSPFVYDGGSTRDPREPLHAPGPRWEASAGQLWHHVLAPLGGSLRRLARAPYISGGDRARPLYVLDDAIFVIRKES